MAEIDIKEGTVPFNVQHQNIDIPCHTYYKIIGDLSSSSPRLVVLHGGPGTGHEYLLTFGRLWQEFGIPVVFYDQIGCAASTHLPQTAGDESFWKESLFFAELDNLLDSLHLRDGPGYHILGQSWGGRIAASFATTQPQGLQRLIIASGIADTKSYLEGLQIIRKQLTSDAQLAINEGEQKEDFTSPRYMGAMAEFYGIYFLREKPFPPKELLPGLEHMATDKTVKEAVAGKNPLSCSGSFKDWTCVPSLHKISVPTFVYNGEFDTSHDITMKPFFEHIPRVRWITFPDAGHMCHLEKPELAEKVFRTVGEFLVQKD